MTAFMYFLTFCNSCPFSSSYIVYLDEGQTKRHWSNKVAVYTLQDKVPGFFFRHFFFLILPSFCFGVGGTLRGNKRKKMKKNLILHSINSHLDNIWGKVNQENAECTEKTHLGNEILLHTVLRPNRMRSLTPHLDGTQFNYWLHTCPKETAPRGKTNQSLIKLSKASVKVPFFT